MRYTMLFVGLLLSVALTGSVLGQGIYIDDVDGLSPEGTLVDGATLTFYFRVTNPTPYTVVMMSNGFKFCGTDMTWDNISVEPNDAYIWDLTYGFPCYFDLGFYTPLFQGETCDTLGIGAAKAQYGIGMPPGFDDIAWAVTLGPIHQTGPVPELMVDSSWYPPAGYWMWGLSGLTYPIMPEWGGPYTYSGYVPPCNVYLDQDPIYLKDLADRVLTIYVVGCVPSDIDLSSILVNGKIPPYTPPTYDGFTLSVEVFIFRFLSAWRPIMGSVQSTFTIEFDTYSGEHIVLEGPVNISLPAGDLNLDGEVDQADQDLLAGYLWHGGNASELEELMDVDQSGRVDAMDLNALSGLIGK